MFIYGYNQTFTVNLNVDDHIFFAGILIPPEGAQLAGYVEEDEAPGGEGEGGVAGGEALPALDDGGGVAAAGQLGAVEGVGGDVAVWPGESFESS